MKNIFFTKLKSCKKKNNIFLLKRKKNKRENQIWLQFSLKRYPNFYNIFEPGCSSLDGTVVKPKQALNLTTSGIFLLNSTILQKASLKGSDFNSFSYALITYLTLNPIQICLGQKNTNIMQTFTLYWLKGWQQ